MSSSREAGSAAKMKLPYKYELLAFSFHPDMKKLEQTGICCAHPLKLQIPPM